MPDAKPLLSVNDTSEPLSSNQLGILLTRANWEAMLQSVSRGFVHELRNPLQAISLSAQTIPASPSDEDVQFLTGAVERASGQLARTIATLSQLYRVEAEDPAPVLLPDVITFVNELQRFQRTLPSVPVEVVVPPAPPPVVGVTARFSHALLCLVTNAKEAIGHETEGVITIRIVPEQEDVTLLVEDTGTGVSPDVASTLFEPFVTTKPGHAGIGLAAAQALVRPFQGRVEYGGALPGGGAVFGMRLKIWPTAIASPP